MGSDVGQHTNQTDFLPKLREEQQLGLTASEGMQGVGTNTLISASETLILLSPEKHQFLRGGEQVALVTELGITFNLMVHFSIYSYSGKGLQESQSVSWRKKLLNKRELGRKILYRYLLAFLQDP